MISVSGTLRSTFYALILSTIGYGLFLCLLAVPYVQNQVIYLNSLTLTRGMDINVPEQWGFLHNQVTPFQLHTSDGETLHAWHVLPIGPYQQHASELLKEPAGLAEDFTSRQSFRLLRDDPEALLVLFFHGASGTLGSGFRPQAYRAISATDPDKIHVLSVEYRGFGTSTGSSSEEGLLIDAVTLVQWAIEVAGIPPSRIVLFGQSLGTAVAIATADHYSSLSEPVLFSGMVLVAPFADVELLTATYRVAQTIPLLEPIAKFPQALAFVNRFITDKWPSKDRLARFIRRYHDGYDTELGAKYWVNILHAEDDFVIPWAHSDQLFWHAVNATLPAGISFEDLEREKGERIDMGAGGWAVERRTSNGFIRQEVLKYARHDKIMSYPAVSLAISRAFHHDIEH